MTVFDLVVLLIANAVQNAMVGPNTSLIGGILAPIVLLIVTGLIAHSGPVTAVLEINGSISVVPMGGTTTRTRKSMKFLRHQ
jgi:uncharacterized membrane protein YcaP (DUF421 family)